MNRLLQLKNQFPIDVYSFNLFVARVRKANTKHVDDRSSDGHD